MLLGNPNTLNGQRDIAITRVIPASSLVQVKSAMAAMVHIDAPGFEDTKVKVRVYLERDGKREEVRDAKIETLQRIGDEIVYVKSPDSEVTLKESRNNEVRLRPGAPEGERRLQADGARR